MKTKTSFLFSLLICLLSVFPALGQEVSIEMESTRSFSGVKSINGQYYYVSYFGEKTETKGMANFIIDLFDKDLKPVKKITIETTKYSDLAAGTFSGKYFMFVFADVLKKTRTFVTLDKEGNVVKKTVEEDVRRALLSKDNYPDIFAASEDEFIIVRPEKEKKFGFEIERVDKDLNVKWTKQYFPDNKFWSVETSQLVNGKLYLLRLQRPGHYSGMFLYSAQCYDINTGEPIYSTDLKDGTDGGYPTFMDINEKGQFATGGMFFKNFDFDEKNSDGLFFTILDEKGAMSTFSKTAWKAIEGKFKDDFSTALFGGKTKILAEDIIRKQDGSYVIVSESFRKSNNADLTGAGGIGRTLGGFGGGSSSSSSSSSTPEAGFTVMNFVFFNFSSTGELQSIDNVVKTDREAVVSGDNASMKGLEMALMIKKKNFFCYRQTLTVNGKQYIMFKNNEGFNSKLYFLPVGETKVEGIPSLDMDKWVSDKTNELGKMAKIMGGNKARFDSGSSSENYELYKNGIPGKEGYMVMYNFSLSKLKIWLEPIPVN